VELPNLLTAPKTQCSSGWDLALANFSNRKTENTCTLNFPVAKISYAHPVFGHSSPTWVQVPTKSNNVHVEHSNKPGSLLILLYLSIILCRASFTVAGFGFSGFSKSGSFSVTSSIPCCSCNNNNKPWVPKNRQ